MAISTGMTTTRSAAQVTGKCGSGHIVRGENRMGIIVATTPGASTDVNHNLVCACGSAAGVRYMTVTVKAEMVCGSRCMASTGPSCSCSCGGENHGNGHTYRGE